jgi:hypothetical protein
VPIDLEVRENGHVLFCVLTEPWTIGEITSIFPHAREVRNRAPYTVHILVDLHTVNSTPRNVLDARLASELLHFNTGYTAIWYSSTLLKALSQIAFTLVRYDRARFFETEDGCWEWLRGIIAAEQSQDQTYRGP